MTCDFMSFSTVFQSCQDYRKLIMKGCVQWNPVTVVKIFPWAGLEPGTTTSVDQPLPTELPTLLNIWADRAELKTAGFTMQQCIQKGSNLGLLHQQY